MRGKPRFRLRIAGPAGNIPAYAGKTLTIPKLFGTSTEHPRVCGENGPPLNHHMVKVGTSPRMRGKPGHVPKIICHLRNIPAYAGKTCGGSSVQEAAWEHPRVCGENDLQDEIDRGQEGTSPRMRGKLSRKTPTQTAGRNIPAYAGKTEELIAHTEYA